MLRPEKRHCASDRIQDRDHRSPLFPAGADYVRLLCLYLRAFWSRADDNAAAAGSDGRSTLRLLQNTSKIYFAYKRSRLACPAIPCWSGVAVLHVVAAIRGECITLVYSRSVFAADVNNAHLRPRCAGGCRFL